MSKIKSSVIIHRPIEQVQAIAWDPQKRQLWQPEELESLPLGPGESGNGKRTRTRAHGPAGLTIEIIQELLEAVPGRHYVFQSRESHGWITNIEQWDYEPVPEGTRVTVQHDVSLHGWPRLFGPVIMFVARRKVEGDMVRLKKLVEG